LACQLTGLSKPTMIMVYNFLRVMCRRYFENDPMKLDGEGVLCQVDELMFTYKPKDYQVEHQKPKDGLFTVYLFITVYKKCKTVIIRYKIQVHYNLYLKSVN
jgi:hypothetical protein